MKIVLGVTGSIAAYKVIDLAKSLLENQCDVTVVLSKSAEGFVSTTTLKSLFPGKVYLHDAELTDKDEMLHIVLAKEADLILIAPASANFIAKLAHGFADCLLSTICLATQSPIMVAPAMNKCMWENQFVQKNMNALLAAGIKAIGPSYGQQACGDIGFGRMSEIEDIVNHCLAKAPAKIFSGKKIVITLGPTREKIDPVRFLSNYSSGKMGLAIAQAAVSMGAEVTIIAGPTNINYPDHLKPVTVESADDMLKAALEQSQKADIFIGCAAVADYKAQHYTANKIKKHSDTLSLELAKTPDVIKEVKKSYPKLFCVAFAAETDNVKEYGVKKLREKNLDMIAINDVSENKVFGQDYNELHVITKSQKYFHLPRDTKAAVSRSLLELINANMN